MVSKSFTARIEGAAKFLATPTAQSARGYLDAPLETALRVLAVMGDGKPHDYEEISLALGLNQNTIRQVIRALERGGYPLTFTHEMVKSTGRPTVEVQTKKVAKRSRNS